MLDTSKLTKNFSTHEFACKHCGREGIKIELVRKLQALRDMIKKPIRVGSGYRCPNHPESLKRPGSKHILGLAADIWAVNMPVRELYRYAKLFGFSGMGINDHRGFLHVDIREGPEKQWCYDKAGKDISFYEA